MVVDGEHDGAGQRAAAAPSQTVERPQYEPTSTKGAPGTAAAAASGGVVQGVALVGAA